MHVMFWIHLASKKSLPERCFEFCFIEEVHFAQYIACPLKGGVFDYMHAMPWNHFAARKQCWRT